MKKTLSAVLATSLAAPALLLAPAADALISKPLDSPYLQWAKVNEAGDYLPGSEWELTVKGADGKSKTFRIKDNEDLDGKGNKPDNAEFQLDDADAADGKFGVYVPSIDATYCALITREALESGENCEGPTSYELKEVKAPAGYDLPKENRPLVFTIHQRIAEEWVHVNEQGDGMVVAAPKDAPVGEYRVMAFTEEGSIRDFEGVEPGRRLNFRVAESNPENDPYTIVRGETKTFPFVTWEGSENDNPWLSTIEGPDDVLEVRHSGAKPLTEGFDYQKNAVRYGAGLEESADGGVLGVPLGGIVNTKTPPVTVVTTVTKTPEPVKEVVTVTETPKPVKEVVTVTETPKPVKEVVTVTETPDAETVTDTPKPVTTVKTVTNTPKPVTTVKTVERTPEPVTTVKTVERTPEPVTTVKTVTNTPEPVVTTVKGTPTTVTETPEPVVTTAKGTPVTVTETPKPEVSTVREVVEKTSVVVSTKQDAPVTSTEVVEVPVDAPAYTPQPTPEKGSVAEQPAKVLANTGSNTLGVALLALQAMVIGTLVVLRRRKR